MSVEHNTNIVTEGLVFCFDPANSKSVNTTYNRNLIDWTEWTTGTSNGTVSYSPNGDGNSRIIDTNPYGELDVVWDNSNNDVASNADGGWSNIVNYVDNTKMYRFTTWMRRKNIGNGSFYLGTYGLNAANANIGVAYRSNNATTTTNPYFVASGWAAIGLAANQWYYIVGHVWPYGSSSGANHADTGIYNSSGTKLANLTDYIWLNNTVRAYHRTYLYYSTDPTTNQQWYQPRMEIVDGNELPLSKIFSNESKYFNSVKDIASSNHGELKTNASISNNALHLTSTLVNDLGDFATFKIPALPSTFAVNAWVKFNSLPGSYSLASIAASVYDTAYAKFYLGFFGSTNTIYGCSQFNNTWVVTPGFTVTTNVWYNFTYVVDTTNISLYANGVLVGSTAYSTNIVSMYRGSMVATQSNMYGGYLASNVVDNNVNTYNHTTNTASEWVKVDFSADYPVSSISITNRAASGYRLNGATVQLLNSAGTVLYTSSPISGATDGSIHVITPPTTIARSVRVNLSNEYLHVAEINVYGPGIAQQINGMALGTWVSKTAYFCNADISTVQLYNKPLSSEEIKINYNAIKRRFI